MTSVVSAYAAKNTTDAGGSVTYRRSHTFAGGTNSRVLIAAIHDVVAVSGAAVNGSAATFIDNNGSFRLYEIASPGAGTYNVDISLASSNPHGPLVVLAEIDDVDTGTAYGTITKPTGSVMPATSGTVTCPSGGAIVAMALNLWTGSSFAISSGTSDAVYDDGSYGWAVGVGHRYDTGAVAWTSTHDNNWYLIVVPVNSASGGGGGSAIAAISNHYRMMRSA